MNQTVTHPRRILLGQLSANGDCLYATAVARQIKNDWPDCHLTWAIGSSCRSVIEGNPHVDAVWEVPLNDRSKVAEAWQCFEREARARRRRGEFDELFLTQIFPNNVGNFDGTVRSSIFRGYPGPMTVPVTPVVRLSEQEVEHAEQFARVNHLAKRAHVVLFECGPLSGQSFVNVDYALEVARSLVREVPGTCVLLSSAKRLNSQDDTVIDASTLTFRENAAITRYCSLLVGCSSGITWLCTSDAAKPLPMIQILRGSAGVYGAVVHDLEHWGLPSDHVIEMRDSSTEHAGRCARAVLTQGIRQARLEFNEPLKFRLDNYYEIILSRLAQGDVMSVGRSLKELVRRYGFRHELVSELVLKLGTIGLRVARTGQVRSN